ncbi:MAG: hypothetical protein HFJ12_04050 [Bacilli bacterium]|nr:hypothetical protein [Bacilli bacterium]
MKEKRNTIIFTIIIAAIAAITAVGIAYAAFSSQLNINGNAKVTASSWKIKFSNLAAVTTTGEAKEITAPTINEEDTKIGDYSVSLTNPGDTVTYKFDVVNEGTFDAKVSSVTISTPTCTGTGDTAVVDSNNVCSNITYTLTYDDGSNVQMNDTLSKGETKSMILTLKYANSVTSEQLPKNDVVISNLSTTIVYSQS